LILRGPLPAAFSRCGRHHGPGESTLEFLQKLSIRNAERAFYSPDAALRQLFRSSANIFGLTKLLYTWYENRQRLPTVSVAFYAF
jgi:hypothetical protein